MKYVWLSAASLWLAMSAATAAELSGTKNVLLVAEDGTARQIGTVTFEPDGQTTRFTVTMDESQFQVEFISMRNFNCIGIGSPKICHLPFGYSIRNEITADDLTDLEYNFLFVFVKAGAPSFDAWNGMYYKLKMAEDGSLTGRLLEADLSVLAVPPDKEYARPISEIDMLEASASKYVYTRIEIR